MLCIVDIYIVLRHGPAWVWGPSTTPARDRQGTRVLHTATLFYSINRVEVFSRDIWYSLWTLNSNPLILLSHCIYRCYIMRIWVVVWGVSGPFSSGWVQYFIFVGGFSMVKLQVLRSNAGYYIGTLDDSGHCRLSTQYWKDADAAMAALQGGFIRRSWQCKECPRKDICEGGRG